jgi:hypothetical protein
MTDFFLDGSGPTLILDETAPTATAVRFRDSASLRFTGGNPWKEIGTWAAEPVGSTGTLEGLRELRAWVGLKNSDDQGTRFDVRVEVYKNDNALVAAGERSCITGVTRNPANASEITVPFGPSVNGDFSPGDVVTLKILTRIGTTAGRFCGGHSNATGLRLYFGSVSRPANFGASLPLAP